MDVQLGTFIQKQAILMKDDFNIFVIYVQGDPNLKKKFEFVESFENGITERIIYYKQSKSALKKIVNARRYKMAQLMGLKDANFEADLCHVHVPYRSAFLALDLKKKGIPFVITEHWSGHINGEFNNKNAADLAIYKQVIGKAKAISTVSNLLQTRFKENTSFDSEVIPNLIEENSAIRKVSTSERIEILTVSDLADDVKNITGLISAFKRANEKGRKLHLTIIGGGPDQELISSLIEDLGLKDSITLRGRLEHSDVLTAYPNCDFYVCNSNFETFGMTVAEALLAGKPVICTQCGGPEEYVHPKNGILIPVKDNQKLSEVIIEMADNYEKYNPDILSNEIRSKFGAENIKSKIKEFYLKTIND
jgi:glycosyltransferase involved in cell wall biosynthesis